MQSPEMIFDIGSWPDRPFRCGAAAAILVSEEFAKKHGVTTNVKIVAQAMTTDTLSTFEAHDMMQLVGYDMTNEAARRVYEQAGVGPEDTSARLLCPK